MQDNDNDGFDADWNDNLTDEEAFTNLEEYLNGTDPTTGDTDGDGIVSDEEIATSERLQQLEIQNEKADAQRNMCWFALWGMLLYPSLVLVSSYLQLDK